MLSFLQIETLVDDSVVHETLSRLGIADKKNKKLYQSCYYVNIDNVKYIMHFKELFYVRDGECNIVEEDYCRRNSIAILLEDWGMISIKNLDYEIETIYVFCLPYKEKSEWTLLDKIKI
jgi:hypothetical protein